MEGIIHVLLSVHFQSCGFSKHLCTVIYFPVHDSVCRELCDCSLKLSWVKQVMFISPWRYQLRCPGAELWDAPLYLPKATITSYFFCSVCITDVCVCVCVFVCVYVCVCVWQAVIETQKRWQMVFLRLSPERQEITWDRVTSTPLFVTATIV